MAFAVPSAAVQHNILLLRMLLLMLLLSVVLGFMLPLLDAAALKRLGQEA